MKDLTTIGIDIAKNYIQIHGADKNGKKVLKKRLPRNNFLNFMANLPKCLIGMEACGGANYWAKELIKLGFEVKLMSPKIVKKFVDNNKNDAKDAQACSEAVIRKNINFVPIKTNVQLEIQGIHRIRSFYIKQKVAQMNMMRGLLLELGIAIPKREKALREHLNILLEPENAQLSPRNKIFFEGLYYDLKKLNDSIGIYTKELTLLADQDEMSNRIQTIKGIGPITATALIAKIGNGSEFKKGRELSAYLGLVPKQYSSGDTQLLLGISKQGDRYIRQLLIHGGRAVVRAAKRINKKTGLFENQDCHSLWIRQLADRVGSNKAAVAVANKNARMVIALLKNNSVFEPALAH
jgi:transposase